MTTARKEEPKKLQRLLSHFRTISREDAVHGSFVSSRGKPTGRDQHFWLEAEREYRHARARRQAALASCRFVFVWRGSGVLPSHPSTELRTGGIFPSNQSCFAREIGLEWLGE
jgi:DUF2934 family protein